MYMGLTIFMFSFFFLISIEKNIDCGDIKTFMV
jgi:hypothetical protein